MNLLKTILGLKQFNLMSNRIRSISCFSRLNSAYDSDGKMTVTVMNQEADVGIMIDSYSLDGFRLNNGVFIYGPTVLFQNTALSWNVQGDQDINEKSLSLFTLLEPKIDILIIGYGKTGAQISQIDRDLLAVRHRHKINIELLPTDRAVATFNFLTVEDRYVAAALIPPIYIQMRDDDIAVAKARKNEIYGDE